MQKWEYCVIGPIKESLHRWEGYYPGFHAFTITGLKRKTITKEKSVDEDDALAMLIAKLGEEGWEMVGCGSTAESEIRVHHFLYFKRAKE